MDKKQEQQEHGRPGNVEEQRTCGRIQKLPERRQVLVAIRRNRGAGACAIFERGGENHRAQPMVEPAADARKGRPTHDIEQRPDHHGDGDNQRQHHQCVGAAAR
ncbi:hypothetical protein D9M69_596440 [compost metagenome]